MCPHYGHTGALQGQQALNGTLTCPSLQTNWAYVLLCWGLQDAFEHHPFTVPSPAKRKLRQV